MFRKLIVLLAAGLATTTAALGVGAGTSSEFQSDGFAGAWATWYDSETDYAVDLDLSLRSDGEVDLMYVAGPCEDVGGSYHCYPEHEIYGTLPAESVEMDAEEGWLQVDAELACGSVSARWDGTDRTEGSPPMDISPSWGDDRVEIQTHAGTVYRSWWSRVAGNVCASELPQSPARGAVFYETGSSRRAVWVDTSLE